MSSVSGWTGTRLVAARAINDGFSSRSWRLITAAMFLLGTAIVVIPRLIGGGPASYTVATVGEPPAAVARLLQSMATAADFGVGFLPVADAAAAEQSVRDGSADVAIVALGTGTTVYVAAGTSGTFPALVSQAVMAAATTQALADAGLDPAQIAAVQGIPPPTQVAVGRVANEGRAGVGFGVGIVLYISLILTGTTIATAVATEKSTRISEVLLAVLRPAQLLTGTVLGVGLLGLLQVAAIGVPVLVGLWVGDGIDVPASAAGDVALGLAWFVLGIMLYAFVFAAMASMVEKVTEVGSATLPVNVVLIGSYLLAVTVTAGDPNAPLSTFGSMFPLSAPMVMPVRWASGVVPVWQLALAMALTVATALLLPKAASQIYARGLTMSGRRLRLREVLRG